MNQEIHVKYEVVDERMPLPLQVEAFGGVIQIQRAAYKLSVGMTIFELDASIAVFNWLLKRGEDPEVEQARDILVDARRGVEGR